MSKSKKTSDRINFYFQLFQTNHKKQEQVYLTYVSTESFRTIQLLENLQKHIENLIHASDSQANMCIYSVYTEECTVLLIFFYKIDRCNNLFPTKTTRQAKYV